MHIAGLTVARPVLDHAEDTGGAQTVVPGVRVYCDLLWIIGEAAVSGGNVIAGYGDVRVRAQGHGHTQRLHPERVVACCCPDLGRAPVTHLLCGGEGVDPVSYTHLRAHETVLDLVCRLLLEKKKQ